MPPYFFRLPVLGYVEVKAGLSEGEKVVENPRALLEEGSEKKPGKGRGPGGEAPGSGGTEKGGKGGAPGGPKGGAPGGPAGVPGGPGGKGAGGAKVGALAPQLFRVPDQRWVGLAWVAVRQPSLELS